METYSVGERVRNRRTRKLGTVTYIPPVHPRHKLPEGAQLSWLRVRWDGQEFQVDANVADLAKAGAQQRGASR